MRFRVPDLSLDETDGVAHGLEPARGFVRNVDAEPLFAGHRNLDEIEFVGAQVLDQLDVVRKSRRLYAEVEDQDVPDLPRYVACGSGTPMKV